MKIVTEAEIDEAIDAKRDTIRQVFTEKLHALSDKEYMDFVSILAKQYVANVDYDDGIIISDALDQYEIRMQTEIQKHTEAVEKHIERIKGLTDETAIKENIRGLIKRVKEWDVFVQPLQLRSQASGMPHDNSMSLGREIRDLALYLHNEKELTEIALDLVTAMQDIFAEVGDLAERLEEDAEQLENIIKTNKVAKELMSEMEALKSAADRMGSYTTMSDVDSFIARVKRLDSTVEDSDVEYELLEKIRISICVVAREAAIKLHNNYQKTNLALKIAKALLAQFGDIDELKTRLQEDVGTELPLCAIDHPDRYKHIQVSNLCSAAKGFCVIDPSGYLKVCNHSPVRVCRYDELDTLEQNEYWIRFRSRNYLPEMCKDCDKKDRCDGGCREAAHVYHGSVSDADPIFEKRLY